MGLESGGRAGAVADVADDCVTDIDGGGSMGVLAAALALALVTGTTGPSRRAGAPAHAKATKIKIHCNPSLRDTAVAALIRRAYARSSPHRQQPLNLSVKGPHLSTEPGNPPVFESRVLQLWRGSLMSDVLLDVQNVSVSIRRSPQDVYAFASNGENLPRWASGIGTRVRNVNGEWLAEGPLGHIRLRFVRANDLGVLDHDVILPSGTTVHNSMRVVPNGTGSTVVFTVLRSPGVSRTKFVEDAQWVERDLMTLKSLLETP